MPTSGTHFKKVQSLRLDYAPVDITQYESTLTGMRIAVVDQLGPKVNGYFALATEIHDDSGAPHTLEHLCFMGSKSYHFKGLLDKLATRAYSGTNAWTATDQTAYTLETAGWAGFAQILPVYLEHLIVPTLTDEGCVTEVHHINGAGEDAGVVYSEMQGVQNNTVEILDLALRRLVYPEGDGFRYETGGLMENLRDLKAERIRAFHRQMYQPKNLRLVVTGEVDHEELLQIVSAFEETILDDVPALKEKFQRPWTDSKPTPPIAKTIVQKVLFPEEDESVGDVMVCYIGPRYDAHVDGTALSVLTSYLCGSSIAVIENSLVEREQLCSYVESTLDNRTHLAVTFSLGAVETSKLAKVEKRFVSLLKEVAGKPLDMDYMRDCIYRFQRQIKHSCENAGDFLATPIIEDHLYGHRDGRDLQEMKTFDDFDEILKWSDQQWRDFMAKWLVDANHISVLGVPSKQMSEDITTKEKARVLAQQKALGEEGLKEAAAHLKHAQEVNDRPIPDSLLEKFPVPSTDSVHFISTTTARSGAARLMGKLSNPIQDIIDKDDDESPLFIHFEHTTSNFVRVKLDMCTASVPVELKPLLTLYLSNFFTTPVMRDGKRMEFEDVVLELERETVGYGIETESANGEMLYISFTTEPERYQTIISWTRTMLFDAIHDPNRLRASLTKILADIPEEKRAGDSMMYSVYTMAQYQQSSSLRAGSTLSKALYLKRMKKLLKDDEAAVLAKFAQVCNSLHRPENFRILVSGDLTKLSHPVSAWRTLTSDLDLSKPLEPLDGRKEQLSPAGRNPGSVAYVVPMATCDSSFALITARGPDSWTHPDLPALMVAAAYMDAVEGPLWAAVRGTGLAYGTGFSRNTATGLTQFKIYRSPDAFKAFSVSKEQVEGYAKGELKLDKFALEGAVSEIVFGMARTQPTSSSAAEASFVNQVFKGISKDWNSELLKKVQAVTPDQIRDAMAKYMVPVFDAKQANLVVTCSQIMEKGLVENFGARGFGVEVRTIESFQDDYGLVAPEGDENGDVDMEDEDDDDEEEGDEEGDEDEDDEAMDTPGSDDE